MSRELPTIEEIAARLAVDLPVENWSQTLCADLRKRNEHEAAAMIETLCRLSFEAEKAVLVAYDALEKISYISDDDMARNCAELALEKRPEHDLVELSNGQIDELRAKHAKQSGA